MHKGGRVKKLKEDLFPYAKRYCHACGAAANGFTKAETHVLLAELVFDFLCPTEDDDYIDSEKISRIHDEMQYVTDRLDVTIDLPTERVLNRIELARYAWKLIDALTTPEMLSRYNKVIDELPDYGSR